MYEIPAEMPLLVTGNYESFALIILPFSTWKAVTGLVLQNAKLGTRNINHINEKKRN